MIKLAFTGQACAGKTTAVEAIYKEGSGLCNNIKFAQPLYDCLEIFDQPKQRVPMQLLSEWAKSNFGRDIFVKIFNQRAEMYQTYKMVPPKYLLNDDCRFIMEAEYLKNNGWKLVYIEADEAVRKERSDDLGLEWSPEHESETEIPQVKELCDFVITNNGDLSVFHGEVLDIVKSLDDKATSSVRDLISRLRGYNEWRLGGPGPQPDTTLITKDIEVAISIIEKYLEESG